MAEYSTEQKKMLFDFLNENCERAYAIDDIVLKLRKIYGDRAPGKSTVYRLITRLVDEGKLRRFVRDGGRGFLYQIIESELCHSHLHLKCTSCGRLLHLERALSEELIDRVARDSKFSVSEEETVLFGKCAECNGRK